MAGSWAGGKIERADIPGQHRFRRAKDLRYAKDHRIVLLIHMTRCLAIFGLLLMCASVADAGLTQVLLQRQRAADLRLLGAHLVTADGHARYRAQPEVPAPAGVHVTYLGTGGLLIERNGAAILSAPYFANNSLFRVGLWCLAPRNNLVDQYLPALDDVQAILVGHAHYDHLLDLPYLWAGRGRHTQIFGNRSMRNLLHGAHPQPSTWRPVAEQPALQESITRRMEERSVSCPSTRPTRPMSLFRRIRVASSR